MPATDSYFDAICFEGSQNINTQAERRLGDLHMWIWLFSKLTLAFSLQRLRDQDSPRPEKETSFHPAHS